MNPIGGFFEIEIPKGKLPYPYAYPINFGRAGLISIIKYRQYRRVWVPAYICDVVFQYLRKYDIEVIPYYLNRDLEPDNVPTISSNDGFIYVDYFGIKDDFCNAAAEKIPNLILDLTQAFFNKPPECIDAFNSARKFFGVPDGGFLFGDFIDNIELPLSNSYSNSSHLLLRLDGKIEEGYAEFRKNDGAMIDWIPRQMSLLTREILSGIDFDSIASVRRSNYNYLHTYFREENELSCSEKVKDCVPLCYPLLIRNGDNLKKYLCDQKIFIPTYWPGISERFSENCFELYLLQNLVCLPIDQRYSIGEMNKIIEEVRKWEKRL